MTSIARIYNFNTIFVYGLFAVAVISVFAYLTLTVATIFTTSTRTASARQSAALTSEIGQLEQTYLTLQQRVNQNEATALGFVAPSRVSIVTPAANTVALSLQN